MSWKRRIRSLFPQEIPGPLAALYERVAVPGLAGFHRQVASEIAASLDSGRVLDVGTGPAHLLVEVARANPRLALVGIDLSRRMLAIAEGLIEHEAVSGDEGAGLGSVRLARADVRELPFANGAFDLVVSTLSLHHWSDPARGIRECVRVTAPGGQCWIYDLRTDVPASTLARLVTGNGLRRFLLGWVFRFHGVRPNEYAAQSVARRLGGGATVRAEVNAAYLKLRIQKAPCGPEDRASWPGARHRSREDSRARLVRCADQPL